MKSKTNPKTSTVKGGAIGLLAMMFVAGMAFATIGQALANGAWVYAVIVLVVAAMLLGSVVKTFRSLRAAGYLPDEPWPSEKKEG